MHNRDLAAPAPIRRSSRRTNANLGWLAFVIEPALIGGFVVQLTLAQEEKS